MSLMHQTNQTGEEQASNDLRPDRQLWLPRWLLCGILTGSFFASVVAMILNIDVCDGLLKAKFRYLSFLPLLLERFPLFLLFLPIFWNPVRFEQRIGEHAPSEEHAGISRSHFYGALRYAPPPGETIRATPYVTRHLLLLMATPHRGRQIHRLPDKDLASRTN